ncbi:beta-lactamase [Magnaporthiopsis poae ATCC 64411]|uniref:Beta-lactamase n=1 Tax=Magnaporthiopsis poae (strain ATCC 64411 / 73-15) TaxID=644358 RepID=A0A0C4DNC0_MAGP6|nr:beta-lactamase [Magnaporthiopsis poae ATCC 64411]
MQPPRFLALLGLGLLAPSGALAAVDGLCPIMGAVLPAPTQPASHAAVQKALEKFKTTVEQIVGGLNRTAVSVAVKSIHESSPLFELHHTPSTLDPRGVKKVDANSVYRLGSISKIFPVLALLKLDGVSLDDKVTKYLPELRTLGDQASVRNVVSQVEWDEITLGALASHLSGVGADYAIDFANFPGFDAAQRGLPPKKNITNPGCAGIPGTRPCTEQDFFKGFGSRAPVFAPFSAPAYSNIGSPLLSFVVERLTNKSYPDFFKAAVLRPLGLNDTGAKKPADSRGVIPLNDTWWSTDIGFETAAGGFYSTPNNMLKFGDAILSNKILSPAATRKWLKPMTNTASLGTQLGAPWEIFRATNVTRDQRAVEIITKGGDLFNYRSTLAMVPDYGLVFTVLLGGDAAEKGILRLYPASGLAAARRQAWRGVYSVGTPEKIAEDDALFPWQQNRCVTWASTDRDVYGLQALDRFVFNVGKEDCKGAGVSESLEMPAYQVRMVKVARDN